MKNGFGFVVSYCVAFVLFFFVVVTLIFTHFFNECWTFYLLEFYDPRDSNDAVYELNGKKLLDERWAILIEDLLQLLLLTNF